MATKIVDFGAEALLAVSEECEDREDREDREGSEECRVRLLVGWVVVSTATVKG